MFVLYLSIIAEYTVYNGKVVNNLLLIYCIYTIYCIYISLLEDDKLFEKKNLASTIFHIKF